MPEKRKKSKNFGSKQSGSGQKSLLDLFAKPKNSTEGNGSIVSVTEGISPGNYNFGTVGDNATKYLPANGLRLASPVNSQVEYHATTNPHHITHLNPGPFPETSSERLAGDTHSTDKIVDIAEDGPASNPPRIKSSNLAPPTKTNQHGDKSQADKRSSPSSLPFPSHSITTAADSGSRYNPIIVVGSSPSESKQPSSIRLPPKTVYSIFSNRKAIEPDTQSANSCSPRKARRSLSPAFPNRDSQHVRGPQSSFISPKLTVGLRGKPERPKAEDDRSFSQFNFASDQEINSLASSQTTRYTFSANSIPISHRCCHPAIQRLVDCNHPLRPIIMNFDISPQQAWVDKWRPLRADQVLGNEQHALYLRDWLRALALQYHEPSFQSHPEKGKPNPPKAKRYKQALKRPRIIRVVEKKRGRKKMRIDSDGEDYSWIVNTDSEVGEDESSIPGGDDNSDNENLEQAASRLDPVIKTPNQTGTGNLTSSNNMQPVSHVSPVFHELKNTILLTGPPGCGKTAAVYACAEELGWEVFEVYPGIGKRSSASLNDLIGEVGKNHIVQKVRKESKSDPKTGNVYGDFFGRRVRNSDGMNEEFERRRTEGEPTNVEADRERENSARPLNEQPTNLDSPESKEPNIVGAAPPIQQSIILLEEVDIVYKEDVNFWPSIIHLIQACKRPLVMTCNDITLVPVNDLPLQVTLTFQPCPTPVAASYLQSLCLAEGCPADRDSLLQLYETTHDILSVDLPDAPVCPGSGGLPQPDLRRAIHQLQSSQSASERPSFAWQPSNGGSMEALADWSTSEDIGNDTRDTDRNESLDSIRWLDTHSDLNSFVDSHLIRKPMDAPDTLVTLYGYEPSIDDEIGHPILFAAYEDEDATKQKQGKVDQEPGRPGSLLKETLKSGALVFYDRDVSIAEEAMRISRGSLEACRITSSTVGSDNFGARALFRARVDYQSRMLQVFDSWKLLPLSGHVMPHSAVFLDYVPWIRHMLDIDEELEEMDRKSGGEVPKMSRRLTRNSQKTQYIRQLMPLDKDREMIKGTTLIFLGQ